MVWLCFEIFRQGGGNAFHHTHADPADTDVRSDNG